MLFTSASFQHGQPIPTNFAFARPHPETHVEFSDNRNPQLAWSEVPAGTQSFALICVDPDAPSVGDDVNQEGRTVAEDLPRADFHHWVMVDIPAECREIPAGSCSDGVVPGGKQDPSGPAGARSGVQDFTAWFAGDPDMGGTYRGYDGPAPPWNDERVHHYRFELHALDLARLDVDGDFGAPDARAAMDGHILATASITGTYTQNPALVR